MRCRLIDLDFWQAYHRCLAPREISAVFVTYALGDWKGSTRNPVDGLAPFAQTIIPQRSRGN
jgi:uncharacterized membrane protein YjdF